MRPIDDTSRLDLKRHRHVSAGHRERGGLTRRPRWAFVVMAGVVVLSSLGVVSPAPAEDHAETLSKAQSPAMLVTSTEPTRTSGRVWHVQAVVASGCVTDPASVRACGPITLRLTYYHTNEDGYFVRHDDVVQVYPPLSQPIQFTMHPRTYVYSFLASQEVCGPVGCSLKRASDPPNGGSYRLPPGRPI